MSRLGAHLPRDAAEDLFVQLAAEMSLITEDAGATGCM